MSEEKINTGLEEPLNKESEAQETANGTCEDAQKKNGLIKDIVQIALFVLIALVFRSVMFDHYVIPSGSMIPTLLEGDRVIVSKIYYGLRVPFTSKWILRWGAPKRGEIIVFSAPTDGTTFIKRVGAIGGDTVEVRNGRLIINGVETPVRREGNDLIEELSGCEHKIMLNSMGGPDFGPTTVPPGNYFMLGDNRGNSQDSRFWGFLDQDLILGHASRIYYRSEDGFRWSPL